MNRRSAHGTVARGLLCARCGIYRACSPFDHRLVRAFVHGGYPPYLFVRPGGQGQDIDRYVEGELVTATVPESAGTETL